MTNFTIIEGETEDYYGNYEEFIQLYNEGKLLVPEIKRKLNLTQNKYTNYRKKALEEKRLNIDIRSPRNSKKSNTNQKTKLTDVARLHDKIYKHIELTWYEIRCKDKKEVKKIIAREVLKSSRNGF